MDYALIDSGKFNLYKEPLRLVKDVVMPTINTFKGQIAVQRIRFMMAFPEQDEQYVLIDKVRTQQIVVNLLSNALKYVKSEGEIRFRINKRHLNLTKFTYELIVQDDGPGV